MPKNTSTRIYETGKRQAIVDGIRDRSILTGFEYFKEFIVSLNIHGKTVNWE